jgi:hypothetical protein
MFSGLPLIAAIAQRGWQQKSAKFKKNLTQSNYFQVCR